MNNSNTLSNAILIRTTSRTLSVKIDAKGDLIVHAPLSLSLARIVEFVNKKENWITTRQTKIKNTLSLNEPIITYKKYLYLGQVLEPIISNCDVITVEDDKYLLVPTKYKNKQIKVINNWLKQEALRVIENRLLYFCSIFNLTFNSSGLINSKSRWGAATSEGDLKFNYRLVCLPPKVIDYVIIHEMAHLIELNHSKRFWTLVKKMMPDYEKYKALIKNCDYILGLFHKN